MDVTGVATIDTAVASHLIHTVDAARLMGATVILTGLSRDVTEALVQTEVDFSKIHIATDLQSGIEEAVELLGYRLAPARSVA